MGRKKIHVAKYDKIARSINAPIYAHYADKIKKQTGIYRGTCLDVGSGGGYLGLALSRITDLEFIFLDISPEMITKAGEHIIEDGLTDRAKTMLADVHSIPLADESVDLVISRGSKPFWKDPVAAIREIFRVIVPGGKTFIGGGRGTPEIRKQIAARMEMMGITGFHGKNGKGHPPGRRANHDNEEIMKRTGITSYTIIRGDDGAWLSIWK